MQHAYLELKLAWELFNKAPETLSEPERKRLGKIAGQQGGIEQRILASAAAANVLVPAATLNNRLAEIRKRYPSDEEFMQDMARIGLNQNELESTVERELRIESVLEKVASAAAPVSAVEAEIYYRLHPEAFDRPEARQLRHILVTYNNGQEKAKAETKLEALRSTLKSPEKFGQAALRHSECPTAMAGGRLGIVKRHQLYPELEAAAFELGEREISSVLASPIGLHILYCDKILPSGMLAFAEVCERIMERLGDKRRRELQREWVKNLGTALDK